MMKDERNDQMMKDERNGWADDLLHGCELADAGLARLDVLLYPELGLRRVLASKLHPDPNLLVHQ